MKRTSTFPGRTLSSWFLGITLLALLTSARAASIGINFADDWGSGSPADGGAEVTEDAYGIPAARWFNMPRIPGSSSGTGVSSNAVMNLPEGGSLRVEWSCINTYSLYADIPTGPGEDQVIYGYLDDTGTGYRVTLSGFRNSVSQLSVRLIASTDAGDGFTDAAIRYGGETAKVQYTDIQTPSFASGSFSQSSASPDIATLAGNNSIVIVGDPRSGALRSTLAGILIDYTPGGSNPPLIEEQPTAPVGTVYVGSPFQLSALASGSPTLSYQWRLNGAPISGATHPSYQKVSAELGDSGSYDVVVRNTFGSVTSSIVQVAITAVEPPVIVVPLPVQPQYFYAGYPVTLSVSATGGQLSYTWTKNGQRILGATQSSLSIPSLSAQTAGTYAVTVLNSKGSVSSSTSVVLVDPGAPYPTAIAATKPLVYFRMSETTPYVQTTAVNRGSLGSAGTGLYVGGYTLLAPGALAGGTDTSVNLAGGRVAVTYSPVLNPAGSFAVECWAKPVDVASGNRVLVQSMINGQFAENANDRSGWVLRQNGANLEFLIGGDNGAPFYTSTVTAPGVFTANAWKQCAVIYDSASRAVRLVVDGVEVKTATVASPVLPNTAAPVLIGDRGYGGWTFKGAIDEVAIYPAGLTVGQLAAHYSAGTNPQTSADYPNLVISDGAAEYLRLNDPPTPPSDNAAENRGTLGAAWTGSYSGAGSTLGNPLIAKGTPGARPAAFPGLGTDNTAVAMTNGWVSTGSAPLGNRVTALVWINRQEISTTGDLSWPAWLGGGGLHLNNGNASNPEAELRYHWNGGEWGWSSGLFVPANTWTFAAFVVEPDKAVIYMSDGSELKSATNAVNHAAMVVTSGMSFGGNQPGRADRNFIGQLDEVAVYDRALSGDEIATIFASTFKTGPVPPSALTLTPTGGEYLLQWTSGVLQSSATLTGTYSDVAGAVSPFRMIPSDAQGFYRLRSN